MSQAQTSTKQFQRKSILRTVVNGFKAKPNNSAENLVDFVKVLENIEITPEKLDFNSKCMRDTNGSIIEY